LTASTRFQCSSGSSRKAYRPADSRVADQNVEAAEFLQRPRDEPRDLARIADVGTLRSSARAARGNVLTRGIRTRTIHVRQHHGGAVGGQSLGDRKPEPACGPGHDCDLSGQIRQPGRPS
jgi:hypothetical protein